MQDTRHRHRRRHRLFLGDIIALMAPGDTEDTTSAPNTDPENEASVDATSNLKQRSDSAGTNPKEHKYHDSEPNPFERSFSGTAGNDGPKQVLPGVSNLTSPAPNSSSMAHAPGWSSFGSLRNGPLSPAMLLGPPGLGGGFDGTLRTGLTPNESSIRTGLTPRGDNSWQLGSPGSMFNHFGSTGLTPGGNLNFLSGPGGANLNEAMFTRPHPPSHLGQDSGLQNKTLQQNNAIHGNAQEADAAANGLFLLSQHSQQQHLHHDQEDLMRQATVNSAKHAAPVHSGRPDFETSPVSGRRGRRKSSFTDLGSPPEETKNFKRERQSASQRNSDSGNESDEGALTKDGKPETDEQKRKNFLERNRQAALKCRQRKKQWLQNLQAKVEFFGQENDQLTSQVTSLREEIVNLKTMLLSHKDCPVARNSSMSTSAGNMPQLQY